MAGILDTLSRTARTAFPIIQRGVREGLSANAIQDVLSGRGLGIRRQTLLDLVRLERGVQETINVLRFIHPGSRPNPDRLPEALTKIRRSFSFNVEVRARRLDTGEPFSQFVTVSTDRLLTRQQIEAQAIRAVERSPDRYGLEAEEALVSTGVRAGPLGTF